MKLKMSIAVVLLAIMITVACNASKVSTYVNLAVNSAEGVLSLAKSLGANVPDATVTLVNSLGTDVTTAVTNWANASASAKPGQWGQVQAALDAFSTQIPQILKDVNLPAQYATLVQLAITAVEAAVNIVEQQNPAVAGKSKATAPFSVSDYKKNYNQQMVAAGHPELQLK